jgi:MFS family permease
VSTPNPGPASVGPRGPTTVATLIRNREWTAVAGVAAFVGLMSVGYYYNLTFVQLGLKDLGERVLGLEAARVAGVMALLAVVTSVVAVAFGIAMARRRWGTSLVAKVRVAFGVVAVQTGLTFVAPHVGSEAAFWAWIAATAVALGVGVPATFAMTVDLVPVADRGWVAALITGFAYLAANLWPEAWTIDVFARQMALLMPGGVVVLGWFALLRPSWLAGLARQHHDPAFGRGRFVRVDADGRPRRDAVFVLLVVLMFAIFFVDSLGFLRLVDTPELMAGSWRSTEVAPRAAIGAVHLVAALIGGVLYRAFPARHLFFWVFGIFALVHFSYGLVDVAPGRTVGALGIPILYAVAVSLYTVANFAVWADLSTPRSVPVNAALGVALSGWTATFLSTGLAIGMHDRGVALADHLRLVDAIALACFTAMLLLLVFGAREGRGRP